MNLANFVSLLRLLLTPAVIWLLLEERPVAALGLFLFAGLTDALDGMIAKRFGQVTELGAYLDPVADKVLLASTFITLGVLQELPLWLVLLAVSRDAMIVGGVLLSYTMNYPVVMNPLMISKLNTVAQIVLVALVLGRMGFMSGSQNWLAEVTTYLVWLTAASTAASGGAYILQWSKIISARVNSGGGRP
ncbi:MAG: CDP-alcohol phosphatidyltransferase family protein [Pseudomonadota bacterium]